MTENVKFIKKIEFHGEDLPESMYSLFDDISGISRGLYQNKDTKKFTSMYLGNVKLTEEMIQSLGFIGVFYSKNIASILIKLSDSPLDRWSYNSNAAIFYSWDSFMATITGKKDE